MSEESLDVRWWPVDGLPDVYDDMRRLIGDAVSAPRSLTRGQSTSSSSVSLDGGSTLAAADQPSR